MPAIQLDEKAVFNVARKIESPEVREEYLRQVTAGDAKFTERICMLLTESEKRQSFLEQPAMRVDETLHTPESMTEEGAQVGPYRLRERIGEGGMGVVYVADQEQPVRRKVALKLIKPGRDTKEVIARFAVERQALALMDHPNIARVLDAGTSAGGRPFFVMELVRGISITDYCDKAKLSTHERLRLFVTVSQAVQHAHQKGIIHRDIKPSNVLITQHDGVPVVKVIDFGLAKALHESFTDHSVYTAFHQMVGTPRYMSPEQAEMSGLDIDTRSDIYSLGVLLYVLLTGKTPLDTDQSQNMGFDEIRRQICEITPPKPSARFSTMKNADLSTIAQQRCIDPARLRRQLTGDLDRIVMKALEKDRNRRYETASAFAEDVNRFLNHEPVRAVAPSMFYLFRKMVRRHRVAIATAVSFLALLLGSAVVSSMLAVQAQREADKSRQQASRAEHASLAAAAARDLADRERKQADRSRSQAEADRDQALTEAYINAIHRTYLNARHADGNELVRFDLGRWVPVEGETDRRGWEWFLLNSQQFGSERFLHGHTTSVADVACSPDGKQLVSLDAAGMMVIWDVESGQILASHLADDVQGTSVAWSSTGTQFATAGIGGTIKIWSVAETVKVVRVLARHNGPVRDLAFDPRGDRLVSAGDDNTAVVWNVESGDILSTFTGHTGPVNSANWHPDGTQIVSTSEGDESVRFWDPTTASEVAPMLEHHKARWATWRADGAYLVTVEFGYPLGRFSIFDGGTRQRIQVRTVPGPEQAEWSPDGQFLATSHSFPTAMVQTWDTLADRPLRGFRGHTFGIRKTGWIDPERVVTCSADHTVRIWNCKPREYQTVIDDPEGVNTAQWSPDGQWLASLSGSGRRVCVLSGRNGTLVREIVTDGDPVRAIAWAPDSTRLATWDFQKVMVWNAQNGNPLMTFAMGPSGGADSAEHSLGWAARGDRLFTAAGGKMIIWDAQTGQRLDLVESMPTVAQWSPDGSHIVAKSLWSHTVVLDLTDPQHPLRRDMPFGEVAAWSPDGTRFATADDDGLIRIRDAQSGAELLRIPGHARAGLTSVSWHPDGTRIASASVLGTIKVWDARTGQELLTFREHAGPVRLVTFSGDGMRLASVGDDGKVNVWDAAAGYARSQSATLLAGLDQRVRAGTADAEDLQLQGQVHSAAGNWDQAALDFERAAELLGATAPKWFPTAEWVIGPYPANLQQPYPPEELDQLDTRKPLRGVAAGPDIPAGKLRWQLAEPSLGEGVNLAMHVGAQDMQSAYAMTRVYAPHERNVTVLIGASRFDEHRLWHNGRLIYEDTQTNVQGRWPDEGNIAITLSQGWNTFLIKVVNIPFREPPFYLYFRLSEDPAFLASAYADLEDPKRAHAALNGFIADHPESPHLYFTRTVVHLRLGDREHAAEDLRRATRDLGEIRVAHLFRESKAEDRLDIISAAIQLMPENVELRAVRADWLAAQERWEAALEDERELARHESHVDRADRLMLLLAAVGKPTEYAEQRRILLRQMAAKPKVAPDEVIACLVQPTTPEELEQIESVYQWYDTLDVSALSDPHGRERKRVEGMLEYRRANYKKAIELLSDAAEEEPQLSEPWMVEQARRRAAACSAYLAMALFREGRASEAEAMLQQARTLFAERNVERFGGEFYAETAIREAERLVTPQ